MAKIKCGAIVVDIRGKSNGHVFTKNRSGAVMRTKVSPSNAQSVDQQAVRAIFTTLSQAWKGLTEGQRLAWNGAVSSYSKTNIFGDLVNPSGINLFQSLNNNLMSIGSPMILEVPLPSAVGSCTILSASSAIGAGTMSLVLSGAVPADTSVKVLATAPMSAGKSFVKSEYRQIDVLAAASATPVNIKAAYLDKFGTQGAAGQKIFFKLIPVNENTGQAGGVSSAFCISVA